MGGTMANAISEALSSLERNDHLSEAQAAAAMREILGGAASGADVERLAGALHARGETPEELVAMATVLRESTMAIESDGAVLDTAGTGGDGLRSFNASTVAAIIAAAAGAQVAKQHDRAVTSRCGATELLDAYGVATGMSPEAAGRCLREAGLCFLSLRQYHAAAFRNLEADERSSETSSLMCLLSLLANPAGARHQLLGVADEHRAEVAPEALRRLGTTHSLVVRGQDGMDEVSLRRPTTVHEVVGGELKTWTLDPRDLGIDLAPRHAVLGGLPDENLLITSFLLDGKSSAYRDLALLNAAAALLAADRVESIGDGVVLARETVGSGAARAKLREVVEFSRELMATV